MMGRLNKECAKNRKETIQSWLENPTIGPDLETWLKEYLGLQKKMKIISLDELVLVCGYFTDCETNNGYGCSHPEAENGECHMKACPIAVCEDEENHIMRYPVDNI